MAIELISAFQDATGYGTFAAWAKWLTTAFTNFGWQQTTDYGQVNWTNLATSNVVPQSSSNTVWTSYVAAASIGTGAGGFAASGGSLVIACAVTTGLAAGKAIQLASLAGAGASAGISAYNGYILTITSVVASTSVTVACPASWSFTYTATAGTVTIQPAFMIFESNDSLSSIAPIYVKLELYAYQNTNTPSFRVTVGLGGTNGYGSLVAPVTAALDVDFLSERHHEPASLLRLRRCWLVPLHDSESDWCWVQRSLSGPVDGDRPFQRHVRKSHEQLCVVVGGRLHRCHSVHLSDGVQCWRHQP